MANPTEVGNVIDKSNEISKGDACRLSQVSFSDAQIEQRRWQILVFVMGCAFVLFLLGAIVFFAFTEDTRAAGIISVVGTVGSGAATGWIVKQRNDASAEKEKALNLVHEYCSEPKKTIEKLEEGAKPADLVVPMA